MSRGFSEVLRGIRPFDGILAGALAALGAGLMVENIRFPDAEVARALAEGSLFHAPTSHSWAMLPVFVLASVAVLWWRRNVIAVIGVALAVVVVHDLAFGWVTRCGAGLPLAFVLAYLGAATLERTRALVALGLTTLLTAAVLVVDATTGPQPIVLALPIVLIVFAIGRAVRHRTDRPCEFRSGGNPRCQARSRACRRTARCCRRPGRVWRRSLPA